MNFLDAFANDPNVAPAFRRIFATPQRDVREVAFEKASPRRFSGEPPTGFGELSVMSDERAAEIRAEEGADHDREEQRARIARGE